MSKPWQLQKAKNSFSELVDRAIEDGPQTVTRNGKPVVVVMSAADYAKRKRPKGSLLDFFRTSALSKVKLDLTRGEKWDRELDW